MHSTLLEGGKPNLPPRGGWRIHPIRNLEMTRNSEVEAGVSAARERYLSFLKLAAATLAVLLALGFLPTERLAGDEGISAMVVGCGVSMVGSVAGTLPFLLSQSRTQVEVMPAVMGSIAVRLVAVIALAAAVAWSGTVANRLLLIWVAISHAGLLVADTRYARAEVRSKTAWTGKRIAAHTDKNRDSGD